MRARNPAVGPQQVTFMKRTLIGHDIKASTPVAGDSVPCEWSLTHITIYHMHINP